MVAKMKMMPVHDLIEGETALVRGRQHRSRHAARGKRCAFLYENGAKEVHMRSACPPIMYGCKYLNFSRSTSEMDLIARRAMPEAGGRSRHTAYRGIS